MRGKMKQRRRARSSWYFSSLEASSWCSLLSVRNLSLLRSLFFESGLAESWLSSSPSLSASTIVSSLPG